MTDCDARIVRAPGSSLPVSLLVPVEDAAHERRDQRHLRLGAADRLGKPKSSVMLQWMPSFSQLLGRPDALPGGGELDQHALAPDARLFVPPMRSCARQWWPRFVGQASIDLVDTRPGIIFKNVVRSYRESFERGVRDVLIAGLTALRPCPEPRPQSAGTPACPRRWR